MIGIMQPYFFPYIGYFQLIQAVDSYVNLDHVAFMKRSYMTRNSLKNNIPISIPVLRGSQNKSCEEVITLSDRKWFDKFYKTLELNYKKEPHFNEVMDKVIEPWKKYILIEDEMFNNPVSISFFNFTAILRVCEYLDIKARFLPTSSGITNRKLNEGLQDIINHFGDNNYVNAIGGRDLYSKEDFESVGIKLNFIKMGNLDVNNPYVSILDLLFRYDKEHLKEQLNKFELI